MKAISAATTAAALGVLIGWWARGHDPGTARKVPAGHGCVTTGPWLVEDTLEDGEFADLLARNMERYAGLLERLRVVD